VSAKNNDAERFKRYEQVIRLVVEQAEFSLADMQHACPTAKPVFITRVVRELEKDGYLQREGPKARPAFRWTRGPSEFSPTDWIESKIFSNRMTRAPLSDRPREREREARRLPKSSGRVLLPAFDGSGNGQPI